MNFRAITWTKLALPLRTTSVDKLWIWLATGFGVGRIRILPGTFGTIVALPLALGLAQLDPIIYMAVTLALVLFSIFICSRYEELHEGHDHKEVVIDEIVGYLIAFAWLPLTWQSLLYSFVLFRFLDIFKPYPISWFDRRVEGGLGVVADDVIAGIITNIILQIVFTQTHWLGYQL